jgi:hypothetical protein
MKGCKILTHWIISLAVYFTKLCKHLLPTANTSHSCCSCIPTGAAFQCARHSPPFLVLMDARYLVQINATASQYFSAPDFFKAAIVRMFLDPYAEYKFSLPPTSYELFDDSGLVKMFVVPIKAGKYSLSSGEVPAINLNGAQIHVVATEAELSKAPSGVELSMVGCPGGAGGPSSSGSTASTNTNTGQAPSVEKASGVMALSRAFAVATLALAWLALL